MRHSHQAPSEAISDEAVADPSRQGGNPIPFSERLTCSIAEACDATGLGRTTIYELIAQASIVTTTVGRRRLIVVRSLRALLLGEQ
jgi:excisionase family DNA binding protein